MDLTIALNRKSDAPLHRQLYEEMRIAILAGRLSPGQRIPSTRSLAETLAISRTTATWAYDALSSEGYITTKRGSGASVCTGLPDDISDVYAIPPVVAKDHSALTLSGYGKNIQQQADAIKSSSGYFSNRPPDNAPASVRQWRRLLALYSRSNSPALLGYSKDALGHRALREAIASYATRARAVRCNADQIMIVNGAQQAIDLIARLFIDKGDGVAMENPGYMGARDIFTAQAARIIPIPVDEEGLKVTALTQAKTKNVKFVFVTPSHQFPMGTVLSLPRRLQLLAWAQKTGAMIIEDDYYSEYRYEGQPIPSLQGLDGHNSVIYIGSFSKILFPSLRIAYLILPPTLITVFARAKWLTDRQSPMLEQYALADFIAEGHLDRHIRRMRTIYSQRRQKTVATLKKLFGKNTTILGGNAGMHILLRLKTDKSDDVIIKQAKAANLHMFSATPFYIGKPPYREFIVDYT